MSNGMPSRDLEGLVKIVLGFTFPFFFLIHWNGFLHFTWYVPLSWLGLETMFLPQMLGALTSASILYAGLYLLSQIVIGLISVVEGPGSSEAEE